MNYYVLFSSCGCCGMVPRLHIGKDDSGYTFKMRAYDGTEPVAHAIGTGPIRSFDDWVRVWPGNTIVNDGGAPVEATELGRIITDRSWYPDWDQGKGGIPYPHRSWDAYWKSNPWYQQGPYGLIRRVIGVQGCIAHGEGPWDMVEGEFS